MSLSLLGLLALGGCFKGEEVEQFYGKVSVPTSQEFRWSDGGLPKVFDPARAAAPPDTDAVRALFEGLTEYEPGTLRPVPAVASRWESSDGGSVWTFHLRPEARWSNGDPVSAQDFVRSWQRTIRLGERAPHANLLTNIEGAQSLAAPLQPPAQRSAAEELGRGARSIIPVPTQQKFGVIALDAHTLRVELHRPDKNFPALVAHPAFRPVHELNPGADLSQLREEQAQDSVPSDESGIVTNGAFNLSKLAGNSVELKRAENYWDAQSVSLERVLFVDKSDVESALAAYRAGDIDAVTNAPVEPLGVKLLTPYRDFRRGTFAALNYYYFNTARPPFDDRRVREALTFALDTVRLSADTLGGATEPANRFLPVPQTDREEIPDSADAATSGKTEAENESGDVVTPLQHDLTRARALLADAGYPGGKNFPRMRLLVNRNEQQRLIAQAVARMWHEALGVETEILVRPWDEYEAMLRAGDYDIARRSIVMQTTDEESNMLELFEDVPSDVGVGVESSVTRQGTPASTPAPARADSSQLSSKVREPSVLTEAEALRELPAIPLHFASSYALVKPYVEGFESNLLDAPSLKSVRINTDWQPPSKEQAAMNALH